MRPIEELPAAAGLNVTEQEALDNWRALPPEMRSMAPHVAEMILSSLEGGAAWASLSSGARTVLVYGAVAILAESRRRSLAA